MAGPARPRGGLGLRLSIVKGLVEAHGSRILVTSREGEGTTFTFSIRRLC
jgi:two-component system phosphate regulon sensor histidine kinase PhoR